MLKKYPSVHCYAWLILLLMWTNITVPVFITGRIWEKTLKSGHKSCVIGLGDWHVAHIEERDQLYDLIESIPKNSLVIVEDSLGLDLESHSFAKKIQRYLYGAKYMVNDNYTTLFKIPLLCEKSTIRCKNVEFRSCSFRLINWLEELGTNNVEITCSKLAWYFKRYLGDIAHFFNVPGNEHEELQETFVEMRKAVKDNLETLRSFMEMLEDNDFAYETADAITLNSLLKTYGNVLTLEQIIQTFLLSHGLLLDMRILNTLAHDMSSKPIFICAGAAHINRIESYITKLGYALVSDKSVGIVSDHASIDVQEFLQPYFNPVRKIVINRPHNVFVIRANDNAPFVIGAALLGVVIGGCWLITKLPAATRGQQY